MRSLLALVITLLASYIFAITSLEDKLISYLAASLIRAEGDYKVYYVEGGKRHWVDSPELFKVHALPWKEVQTVPKSKLGGYAEGEKVTASSTVILTGEEEKLPDLVVFPARELHLKESKGRLLLMFSTTFWNLGRGALELLPGKTSIIDGEERTDVFNRIYRENGEYRDKLVGNFQWHDAKGHNHYHYSDFADYILARLNENGSEELPTMKEKVSYCVLDEMKINLGLPGAPKKPEFPKCSKDRQGLSVGWADDYEYDIAGQNFDITDLPAGQYSLIFVANPRNRFVELRTDNNKSFAILNLDPANKKMEIVARTAAFEAASTFPNGMLIQSEEDKKVYYIHNNKKRWLRGGAPQATGQASDIYILPQSIIDLIPYNNLVSYSGKVYALNDAGYIRHIRNSEIFSSYNLSWDDVADISFKEFADYKNSRLVRVDGEGSFYYISGDTLQQISYIDAFYKNDFNFSKDEVQTINKADFASYKLK